MITMSIPSQWDEQLLAEWKALEGFFVEPNVMLTRNDEADINAVKVKNHTVFVEHLEVGFQSQKDNLGRIKDKFTEGRKKAVIEYVRKRLDFSEFEWNYSCKYIYSYASGVDKLRRELKQSDIEFIALDDVIQYDIPNAIKAWKRYRIDTGKVKKQNVLPRKYRLLSLIDASIKGRGR